MMKSWLKYYLTNDTSQNDYLEKKNKMKVQPYSLKAAYYTVYYKLF